MIPTKEKIKAICYDQIIPIWFKQPDTLPSFLPTISESKKKENELFLTKFFTFINTHFNDFPSQDITMQKEWAHTFHTNIDTFMSTEKIINISSHMSRETLSSFKKEVYLFIKEIRKFDDSLSMENIWQALRNYLIYGVILDLENKKQYCNSSILAYSLLYPYTDNYIDDSSISIETKTKYNQLIANTLTGKTVSPSNLLEEKTYQLLQLITTADNQTANETNTIAQLLLYMLEAQQTSIRQQHKWYHPTLSDEEILKISSYKGGVSVLIDYYLTENTCLEDKIPFYLAFGLILQLADDLQDIKEDKKKHHHTLMTHALKKHTLEQTTNKLLYFIHTTITNYQAENQSIKMFMLNNCYIMILMSVITCKEYFSSTYIKNLEPYIPFTYTYLNSQKNNMPKSNINLSNPEFLNILDIIINDKQI